jgi:hypothetical protein
MYLPYLLLRLRADSFKVFKTFIFLLRAALKKNLIYEQETRQYIFVANQWVAVRVLCLIFELIKVHGIISTHLPKYIFFANFRKNKKKWSRLEATEITRISSCMRTSRFVRIFSLWLKSTSSSRNRWSTFSVGKTVFETTIIQSLEIRSFR